MKTASRMTWGLVGVGVLALAAPALADRAALDANRTAKFRELDRNGNGSLDRGEYGGHPGNFRALDQNRDGGLSLEEFVSRQDVRPEPEQPVGIVKGVPPPFTPAGTPDLFTAKDHDSNGVVDRNEWPDAAEFNRRDVNRDGVITSKEYFAGEPAGARKDDRFGRMDANGDGVLSRGEWKGGSRTFERSDLNGDGVISRTEYSR
jgi:hypothetical protein